MKDMKATKKSNGAKKNELAPLKVKAVEKAAKKGDIPTIMVEGDYPTRYNEAAAVKKDAEGLMADMKPVMLPDAMAELYRHNAEKPWDAISSVKLQDDSGEVTRITFSSKYSAVAPAMAEALFGEIKTKDGKKPDINDYLVRTMVGTFDSSVFLGPDGRFDQKKYDKIKAALDAVSRELGITNPLSTNETVVPLPDFHARRWMDFSEVTNRKITEVIPNQINFVPCPKAAEGEESK
jgi:hypothetical protein